MPTPHAAEIVLFADERAELEGWARRRTSAAGLAVRARIVMAAADGESNTELAARLGLAITTVRRNSWGEVTRTEQKGPDHLRRAIKSC